MLIIRHLCESLSIVAIMSKSKYNRAAMRSRIASVENAPRNDAAYLPPILNDAHGAVSASARVTLMTS